MSVGLLSTSGSSLRKDVATDCSASCGQALNQSMVQQLTRDGNCLRRALNTSPTGLQMETDNRDLEMVVNGLLG